MPRLPLADLLAAPLATLVGLAAPQVGLAADAAKQPVIACEGNERNLQTYLKIHKVLFMDRDSTRVEEFYAPEVISHNLDSGGGAARPVKSSAMAAMWAASKKNDPGRVLADDLILCTGDYVVVRTTLHGTDNTGVEGWPATGKSYAISATDIYRFKDDKVVERWGNADLVSMFRQIGYTLVPADKAPAPPTPPKHHH
jgi:predicted ester cyclase